MMSCCLHTAYIGAWKAERAVDMRRWNFGVGEIVT